MKYSIGNAMIKNTNNSYGSLSKFFHWFIAIVILGLLTIGFWLKDLGIPMLYHVHKTMGFLILLLVIARLLWRFGNITPSYDATTPKWMRFAAHLFHYGLYALMLIMPLSAFIASNAAQYPVSFLFLFDMPLLFATQDIDLAKKMMLIHKQFAVVMIAAISIHILAALYHHFIKKDNVLTRMLPSLFGLNRMKH
jgi:cytochrome b561